MEITSGAGIGSALQQAHLAEAVIKWGTGLDFEVSERGDNLLVGQLQLLCAGRAVLKGINFVEATSNCDMATDNLSQVTIQETFQLKAVFITPHRNKIAVMDAGRVAEFDAPSELLVQPDSIFASLAK